MYNPLFAQTSGISLQNLGDVKVDQLSDDQISQFWSQAQGSGMSLNQLEQVALQKKMPRTEFAKLKSRIEKLAKAGMVDARMQEGERSYDVKDDKPAVDKSDVNSGSRSKVFGAELFSNKNLTFEPNLKIATPSNYQLGPDDELNIDISGSSEANFKLKVSPEGSIRIPNLGPITVSGLTIEQARKKITSSLVSIYSAISTGETMVAITLGNIRSIKVTILGEITAPGTYTLPSLATVFNALYASGGPNQNGSFRNITVIRNNKFLGTVDVYDFLMKGETKNNFRLQDQDVIRISPYECRVELRGEVKRPGFYEALKKESLKDLIEYAGGYTDNVYKERVKIFRNTNKEKSVADIASDQIGSYKLQNGDIFLFDRLLDRFSNRVSIEGAVFRPGSFALESGLTLSQLIKKADGLTEDALTTRGLIYRLKEDNSFEVLSFVVSDVTSGKNDIVLKREDKIRIPSKLEMREQLMVTITGGVNQPGVYPFAENMHVEDLIILAGGLKESTSTKAEISRRIKNTDPNSASDKLSNIIQYQFDRNLARKDGEVTLEPFDNVTVFLSPSYQPQRNVLIEGEVLFPGQYSLTSNKEKLSDIIQRCGNLKPDAFPEGAILIRNAGNAIADNLKRQNKIEAIKKITSDTAKQRVLTESILNERQSMVGIDLGAILKNPNSKKDINLEDGDIIYIPKTLQTIQVSGEVLYPVKLKYEKGKSFNYYVKGSGGYSSKALRRKAYIVYSNGTAASTEKILFVFNSHPKVKPGSEIFVPVKEEKRKLTAVEVIGLSSSLATMALLFITVFKK
jgi:protein involved in polysaccharide export with SLBB domain